MLAVDLEGYTTYCTTRDSEDVHLSVRPLMNRLRRACEERGGVVATISGDGFLAVFGGREGRPDDPHRAVLASVEMQRLVREQQARDVKGFPSLRGALHVGEVVVAPSWEHGGFSVSGDAVNVVSRLCGLAAGGTVLASRDLALAVPAASWGPQRVELLRNRPTPVETRELHWWQVEVPTLSRREVSGAPFLPRPEVESALALLRSGRDVQLIGEPGIGKSRLATEVAQRFGTDVVLSLAFMEEDGDDSSLRELARGVLGELSEHGGAGVKPLVTRRVRDLSGGVSDTVERDSREDQVEALGTALRELGRERSVLLLVEDGHWCGWEGKGLLRAVLAQEDRDFRVLATSREVQPFAMDVVQVGPLAPEAAADLVQQVLPGAEQMLVSALVDRSGGVPLAIEQYARLLLEDGTVERQGSAYTLVRPSGLARLPAGLRLFVSSRLDRLPPATRSIVAAASVAGRAADPYLVRYLSGSGEDFEVQVELLVERGFLRWESPTTADSRYLVFTHQVLQDVAYESLLRHQRVTHHLAAARWFAVLPIIQLVSEEAHHLEAAVALGSSDCEVVRRTVEVMSQYAASLVEERTALAVDVVERAERIVAGHPQCDVDTLRLRITKADTLARRMLEGDALQLAEACITDAVERGDQDAVADASLVAGAAAALSEPHRARAHFARAEEVLAAHEDRAGLTRLDVARVWLSDVLLPDRLAVMERAHGQAMRIGDLQLTSSTAQDLAMFCPGRDPRDAEHWRGVVSGLLRRDDIVGEARMLWADAYLHYARQERTEAIASCVQGSEAAADAASQQMGVNCDLLLLTCLAEAGRLAEAESLHSRLLGLAETRPTDRLRVDATLPLVLVRSRQGRVEEARALLSEVRETSERLGPHYVAEWDEVAARHAQDRGDFAESSRRAQRARDAYAGLGLLSFALRAECVDLASRTAVGAQITLTELANARARARDFGSDFALALLGLGGQLRDLLLGHRDREPELFEHVHEVEVRALALETRAIWEGTHDLLLDAAETWSALGTTVWQVRSLLWHAELTGGEHREAVELLAVLDAPTGLADTLRAQVRGLRAHNGDH
jgi:class 3 adenylate cyclase